MEEDMTSALVVGGSGFLGQRLLKALDRRGVGTYVGKPFAGGIQFDATRARLGDLKAPLPADLSHVFILYGAVNPDWCARDPQTTRQINVDSIVRLIEECFARGLTPVFMSTDYVYEDHPKERSEDERRSPTTEYGRQKSEVEAWLEKVDRPWLICRSSKIVSGDVGIHSVLGQWVEDIKAGRTIRCATDQIFTPGHVDDIATAMVELADTGRRGIYHVAGPESMSRYDLAALLIENVRRRTEIAISFETCRLSDIPFFEKRPLNTSISTAKLRNTVSRRFVTMADLAREVAMFHFPDV
jgi:dTDP-4-dehydrorhamnose reductase